MATGRTRVGDIDIEWEEHGEGSPPFVLVHGFTGARSDFEEHFAALAESRRVVAADHRGHGGSTNTGDGATYTLDVLTDDLIGFLEAEVRGPADLLGHSMGGMIVLRLALRRPELVRSLILMDTAGEPPVTASAVPDVRTMVEQHGVRRVVEMAARSPERALLIRDKGAAWVESDAQRRLSTLDPEAFVELLPRVFRCDDLLDRLPKIQAPTTVLVGSEDAPFLPPSKRIAAGIRGSRLEIIEGAFHSPQHTHPREWLEVVCAHLARADAASV